jgi:hypothetical protein
MAARVSEGVADAKREGFAIGELLMLLSKKASHDVLTQKVEALQGQIHFLFAKPSSKK